LTPTEAHRPFSTSGSAAGGRPIPIAAYNWTITPELKLSSAAVS
jgi:hypothetical protein